jgi:HemY protein
MKLLLLLALAVLLGGSLIGELIVQDPGYVLLSYQNTTIETSIWGLAMIAMVLFTGLYLLLQLTQYLLQRRRKLRQWSDNHSQKRAIRRSLSGLNALSCGQWSKGQRLLSQAAPHSGLPLVNYLAAARAAHEQNQHESCDELLNQARRSAPKAEVAVGIVQSRIQVERGQWESALATLSRLRHKAPKHSLVLRLLTQVYTELKDWGAIVQLLPDLRKLQVYNAQQLQQLEQQVYLGYLQSTLDRSSKDASPEVRSKMLSHSWKAIPRQLRQDPTLIERQVELLLDCDDQAQAEQFLKEQLKKQWQPQLVALYGRIEGADTAKQFRQALAWQQHHPRDAQLQLALGRLALRNNEWLQAKKHFQQSLELASSTEAYSELARLLARLEEKDADQQLLAHLDSLTAELPVLPLPEGAEAEAIKAS